MAVEDATASSELEWVVPVWLSRSELLLGPPQLKRLADTNVLLVGLGGVGSFAAEFMVR